MRVHTRSTPVHVCWTTLAQVQLRAGTQSQSQPLPFGASSPRISCGISSRTSFRDTTKVLGEGSPAFHFRELFLSKSSSLTLKYSLSSANLADPPLEVQSALGESFNHGVPTRGCVDNVKQFQEKHLYIGRGGTRGRRRSAWANPFSVSTYGRQKAIARFERYLRGNGELLLQLPSLRHHVPSLSLQAAPRLPRGHPH